MFFVPHWHAKRADLVTCHLLRSTTANKQRCIVQEVVGLLPDDALLLNTHEEFYAAGIARDDATELGRDSEDDQTSDHSDIAALPQSDDEENLDDAESVTETATGTSTTAGTKRKRKPFQPTTPEDVAERRVKVFVRRNKYSFG